MHALILASSVNCVHKYFPTKLKWSDERRENESEGKERKMFLMFVWIERNKMM